MSKNSVRTILITLYLSAVQDPEPLSTHLGPHITGNGWELLNLSVPGFSFVVVFHDKAKRTQQGNLLGENQTF